MAKCFLNRKRSSEKKIISLNFITSKKTTLMIFLVAVFSFVALGMLSRVNSAAWTDPLDSENPPDSTRDQSPINIGPQFQDKNGPLILQSGLETDNHFNIYDGNLNVINNTGGGNAYIDNRLQITEGFNVYPDLGGGLRAVRIGISRSGEGCQNDDQKELQVSGTKFYPFYLSRSGIETAGLGFGIDQAVLTVNSSTTAGPALLSQYDGHFIAISGQNRARANGSIGVKGVGGDAAIGRHTFGIYGLAGQREDPFYIPAIPYAGYFQGTVYFAEPSGTANQPFYINSEVLIDNLNVDKLNGLSCENELSCDLCLKDSFVAAAALVQPDQDISAQPGGLHISGLAQFDKGVSVKGLSIDSSSTNNLYAQVDQTSNSSLSSAVHCLAGSGPGNDFAAYFEGPVAFDTPYQSLTVNSRALVQNLNADQLNGYQAEDFLKYSDLAEGITRLDDFLIRSQSSSPGLTQNGHLSLASPARLTGSLIAPKISFQTNGDSGTALDIQGSDLSGSYAVFAQASGSNQLAAYFDGDVGVVDHNLHLTEYLKLAEDSGLTGIGTIPAGQTGVELSSEYYNPEASLIFTSIVDPGSSNQAVSLVVSKNPSSFSVSLFALPDNRLETDLRFNYFIVNQQ